MSISMRGEIMERIQSSENAFSIFGGAIVDQEGKLDCVPANTVDCINLIAAKNPYYICTLNRDMPYSEIEKELKKAEIITKTMRFVI